MYSQTLNELADQAVIKLDGQRQSIVSHIVRSMLAGMYVGACIVLIFTVGGTLAKDYPAVIRLVMGVCFGGALTFVIFAGSELFTGSNLILTAGVMAGKASARDLTSNWIWTWIGNLLGSALLAVLVIRSGVLSADPVQAFVLKVVQTKMTLPWEQLFWRAVLANWLVCLGVWLAARAKSEPAKIILIWWCMFTFITCGFEHSVANMCGLLLGLLLPHGSMPGITWSGYAYNLSIATAGNIVGGALFVAGMYWLGSKKLRSSVADSMKRAATPTENNRAPKWRLPSVEHDVGTNAIKGNTMNNQAFTEEQKNYLEGFVAGTQLKQNVSLNVLPTFAATLGLTASPKPRDADEVAVGPDAMQRNAQDRIVGQGRKLCNEENAKRKTFGLDIWDTIAEHARDARFPKGTDVFLFKFQGMFHVAPAQDSFMCRLRLPGGILSSHQLSGIADLAEQFGGGYTDITTRANLQIRQIGPQNTIDVLMGLTELGIITRGAGADNVRNITANPTAGIDRHELIDTRPIARQMHHYILHHRELYGLPRKFNIAFDGGGSVSTLEETNDIGFSAVKVEAGHDVPPGVYFRMQLGGITGHHDFARDTGLLLTPAECVPVAAAVLRVFINNGDRTDRKKARLKYLLDEWGDARFIEETEKQLGRKVRRLPLDRCIKPNAIHRMAHVGFHPQKQSGLSYVGITIPAARMTAAQMRGVATIAARFGSGTIRLTVWQNLLISDLSAASIDEVKRELTALNLGWSANSIRAGLVACTGNVGCKYAASNTKAHAVQIADYLETRLPIDQPINIHLTGCHHSCAQHFIGDIGLLATKILPEGADDAIEGYHIFIGGGYGTQQRIGREIFREIPAEGVPQMLERMLAHI